MEDDERDIGKEMAAQMRQLGFGVAIAALTLAIAAALTFAVGADAGYGPKLKPRMKSQRVISANTFSITGVDNPQRYQVYCPRGKRPLGGGVSVDPLPEKAGGGAYPVSYERLGQQEGWHISVAQVGRGGTTSVHVQVLCRRYRGDIDPEEKFIKSRAYKNIGPGRPSGSPRAALREGS